MDMSVRTGIVFLLLVPTRRILRAGYWQANPDQRSDRMVWTLARFLVTSGNSVKAPPAQLIHHLL